ncbi:hypothetical protein C8R43DRAFT_1053719 [Mycena crocata]|nr:hypothetical protein C8R43DRAFT_1053719 [Mycena crocata]
MGDRRYHRMVDLILRAIRHPAFKVRLPTVRSGTERLWARILAESILVREGFRIKGRGALHSAFRTAFLEMMADGYSDEFEATPGLYAALEAFFLSEEFFFEILSKFGDPDAETIVCGDVKVKGPLDVYMGAIWQETQNDDKVTAWFVSQIGPLIKVAIEAYESFRQNKKARIEPEETQATAIFQSDLEVLRRIHDVITSKADRACVPPSPAVSISPPSSPIPLTDGDDEPVETPTQRRGPRVGSGSASSFYRSSTKGASSVDNAYDEGEEDDGEVTHRSALRARHGADGTRRTPLRRSPFMGTSSPAFPRKDGDGEEEEEDDIFRQLAPHARPSMAGAKYGTPGGAIAGPSSEYTGTLLPAFTPQRPKRTAPDGSPRDNYSENYLLVERPFVPKSPRSPLAPRNLTGDGMLPSLTLAVYACTLFQGPAVLTLRSVVECQFSPPAPRTVGATQVPLLAAHRNRADQARGPLLPPQSANISAFSSVQPRFEPSQVTSLSLPRSTASPCTAQTTNYSQVHQDTIILSSSMAVKSRLSLPTLCKRSLPSNLHNPMRRFCEDQPFVSWQMVTYVYTYSVSMY